MIYVATDTYRTFQSFMQEFHLREDHGSGGNREGQCRFISDPDQLRGINRAIVLMWNAPYGPSLETMDEIWHLAQRYDIPVLTVPDLRQARARREHPEAFPPTFRLPDMRPSDRRVRVPRPDGHGGD